MSRLGPILLLGIASCAAPALRSVPRVVDGKVERGPFVSPYAYQWFIEGEMSAAKGQHGEAAMALESAAAAPANDVLLLARLAEEYELSGDSRRADRALTEAQRDQPDSARVALAEGRIRRARGDRAGALASFARAKRLDPLGDEPVVETAKTLIANGHVRRATAILLEHVRTSVATPPDTARRLLVDLARRSGDAESLEQALALDPGLTPEARARAAASLALETGRPALAARILSKQLESQENTALWLRALVESGDRQSAARFLAGAESHRLGGLSERADLLFEVDEIEGVLRLLKATEGSPGAEYAKGRALLARGDFVRAAVILAAVPFGAASFEDARLAFAECSASQGRHGAAVEALSQAPHESLAVKARLAELYLEEGDLRAGLRLFDPKQSMERAALAELFEKAGQFEEAAAYYATVKVRPSDEPGLRARASAEQLAVHGHLRSAVSVLERWTTIAPADLHARVRLVELLLAEDRVEAAGQVGRHTLSIIDDPVLRDHLKRVLDASHGISP